MPLFPRWILAVDPRPGELHVIRRLQRATGIAALPTGDLVRLAPFLGPPLPLRRPGGVARDRLALFLVPVKHLVVAVRQHAHVDRAERGRPELRGRERALFALADAVEVVLPKE